MVFKLAPFVTSGFTCCERFSKNSSYNYFRLLYQIFGYAFHLFYILVALPAQFINIYLIRDDIQKLVESSFFTLTCAAYVVKLAVLLLRRTEIEEFLERLQGPIFFSRRIEHLMVLKNSVVIAKASSRSLMVLVLLTCVCWILFPLVDSTQVEKIDQQRN